MAVVATGFAVGSGSLSLTADGGSRAPSSTVVEVTPTGQSTVAAQAEAGAGAAAAEATTKREEPVLTRSDSRAKTDPLKKDTLALGAGNTMSRTEDLSNEDPRDIARALLAEYGWSLDQFGCLDSLWMRESQWNPYAENSSSGAYGIPQSLPGSKMASVASDWRTNPVTQIRWGLGYIADRYGSPCGAWGHSQGHGWY
jgi:hypothetical protein